MLKFPIKRPGDVSVIIALPFMRSARPNQLNLILHLTPGERKTTAMF